MRFCLCVPLVLTVALATPATADDVNDEAIKKDRQRIAGTWKIVALVINGKEADPKDLQTLIVVNEADGTWSLQSDGKEVSRGTSTLDPTAKPKTIDFTPTNGSGAGKDHLGIYQLGKDKRKLCFAAAEYGRPSTFASEVGSQSMLVTFARMKAKK